ncbi:hypothetical protein JOQ06_023382 [Pogonophryne albipinna]|uniref:Uncharacterized protein n=1 Tax=Pogonophryne albipinna TaxID=1090488 RepID=A0AAD6BMP6_9TELE|nr:hypothetical protein JOQ06_023382 [Pogonophryne albipinna]
MENSPVEMAGLREGSWIVQGAGQRGALSGYSGAGIPRIAEHDAASRTLACTWEQNSQEVSKEIELKYSP